MLALEDSITGLASVTQQLARKLERGLGIRTIRDLLWHIPVRYEDVSALTPIGKLGAEQHATIEGTVGQINMTRTWKRRMIIVEALVSDETGSVKIVWFNQPWIAQKLKHGEHILLSGKYTRSAAGSYFAPVFWETTVQASGYRDQGTLRRDSGQTEFSEQKPGLLAIYPETEGVTSRWLRFLARSALQKLQDLPESLPETIRQEQNLMPFVRALRTIHFPQDLQQAQDAKHRLSFEELFTIECAVLQSRVRLSAHKAPVISMDIELIRRFLATLPWKLTDAQRKAAFQILRDMQDEHPMNRLLAGEVGSGKTLVAAIAMLNAAKQDYQSALMAPTEILAQQHFKTLAEALRSFKIRIALLTGSSAKVTPKKSGERWMKISRPKMWEQLQKGEVDVLVGTHALIAGNGEQRTENRRRTALKPKTPLRFKALGLAIVDEQHRFGVSQRAKLQKMRQALNLERETWNPHFLTMTATPIPRSLALTLFGDLDLSTMTELPKERLPVETRIIHSHERQLAYNLIRKEIEKGHQAFVICPLVKKSEKLQAKAAEVEYERLSTEIFRDLSVGLLHGQMDAKEKEKIMQAVKRGKIDILVATSVVEVGIDVPNATIIAIEGTERFGLAQLYQLRGRVGRSKYPSQCLLCVERETPTTMKRLRAMAEAASGPELAQKDLAIRGPGELAGARQSGMPDIAMQALQDIHLIEQAREAAKEALRHDPTLRRAPALAQRVRAISEQLHLS